MQNESIENKNAKHKFDELYNIWLWMKDSNPPGHEIRTCCLTTERPPRVQLPIKPTKTLSQALAKGWRKPVLVVYCVRCLPLAWESLGFRQ